jgi:3-oxoadipate CoA-transferase, alpha subunit
VAPPLDHRQGVVIATGRPGDTIAVRGSLSDRQGRMKRGLLFPDAASAVADVADGSTVMFGGFAGVGVPLALIAGLNARGATGLTVIANGTGERQGRPSTVEARFVARAIVSFPVSPWSPGDAFQQGYEAGTIELEIVPQGTLAERIRAGGAGIPAFYTPTGVGTSFADGKEVRDIDGKLHILEHALKADYALVRAYRADTKGNLVYRNTGRNFNPIMAAAARVTIAEVDEIVEAGELDPELIVTPGIYVNRVVVVGKSDG